MASPELTEGLNPAQLDAVVRDPSFVAAPADAWKPLFVRFTNSPSQVDL